MTGLGLQLPGQTLVDIFERLPGDLDGRALGCDDPDSPLQINSLVHIGDPLQFAAYAWRHDQAVRDGPAWLRAVVSGQVVQDLPTDGP